VSTTAGNLEAAVEEALLRAGLSAGESLLVGFSGGPDSLCLLGLCLALRRSGPASLPPFSLGLAYLDHGIRAADERWEEGALVSRYARRWGLPLHTGEVEPGLLKGEAERRGLSLEDLARNRRRDFFRRVMEKEGYTRLLLAHHGDDQGETLLMRLLTGSGPGGLGGISPHSGFIIRPLLGVPKRSLLNWLAERDLPYITDSTNQDETFLRNRIRRRLMPPLREFFPHYQRGFSRTAALLREAAAFIREESLKQCPWERAPGGRWTCGVREFFAAPPLLRRQSLFTLYNRTFPGRTRLPGRFLDSLSSAVRGEETGGGRGVRVLLRGHGIRIIQEKNSLFWSRDIVIPRKNQYCCIIEESRDFFAGGTFFSFRAQPAEAPGSRVLPRGLLFDPGAIAFPLIIRTREPGDRIRLSGGTVSLKKLFSSWGIPEALRWRVPVVEDAGGIWGVLAAGFGGKNCLNLSRRGSGTAPAEGGTPYGLFYTRRQN
jgi:tRNA(Ile)-lysidine synthase